MAELETQTLAMSVIELADSLELLRLAMIPVAPFAFRETRGYRVVVVRGTSWLQIRE